MNNQAELCQFLHVTDEKLTKFYRRKAKVKVEKPKLWKKN